MLPPMLIEYLLILGALIIPYVVAAEWAKAVFYRHVNAASR